MSDPQHEPSMEEILASIRKIISEDAPATPEPAAAPAPQAYQPVEEPDVLELTQVAPAAPASDIFSDSTRKALEDAFDSIPDEEPAPAPVAPRVAPSIAPVDGSTVESVFERAVRESFEPVLNKYLDDNSTAVIERMKPLIREWMDEHFPPLLEGAVRAEVKRVVRSRGAKR